MWPLSFILIYIHPAVILSELSFESYYIVFTPFQRWHLAQHCLFNCRQCLNIHLLLVHLALPMSLWYFGRLCWWLMDSGHFHYRAQKARQSPKMLLDCYLSELAQMLQRISLAGLTASVFVVSVCDFVHRLLALGAQLKRLLCLKAELILQPYTHTVLHATLCRANISWMKCLHAHLSSKLCRLC